MQGPNLQVDNNLEGILEVSELFNLKNVNELLGNGNWRLLEIRTEKVRKDIPVTDSSEWLFGLLYEGSQTTSFVQEELITKYVLGRYKRD